MALVCIMIQDRPDNTTEVRLDCEPVLSASATEFTLAQQLGASALAAIEARMRTEPPKIIVPSAKPIEH